MLINDREKIVFVGDSITDAGRKHPIGCGLWDGVGTGFVRAIDTLLNVLYPEKIFNIANMGCSGHTTRDLIARWQSDVLDLKPDVVFCMIGVNDVWRTFDEPQVLDEHICVEEYAENLQKLVDMSKDIKKFIFITPYYMEPNKEDFMAKTVLKFASAMKEVARKNGLQCIDVQPDFDEYLKFRHSSYLMWDRVHPGPVGSMIIAKRILKEIGIDKQLF